MAIIEKLHELKDSALSHALKGYIGERFSEYGEVLECTVDTSANTLHLRALLRGESAPVTASIDHYEIEKDAENTYIVLHKLSASREWLSRLLDQIAEGSRHKIPAAIAVLL